MKGFYKMDFVEKINCNNGLLTNFYEFIKNEILNNLKEHPDLDEFIKKNKIGLTLKTYSIASLIEDDLKIHKGHITKDYTKILLRNYKDKESNSGFSVWTEWDFNNGKVYIIRFIMRIATATIAKDICDNIFDLPLYKEQLKWLIKHEMGHMIDHMRNRHNVPVETLEKLLKQDDDNYEQYYEELSKIEEWTPEIVDDDNRKYYGMKQEADANMAIGIDVEDLIKLYKEMRDKYKNKSVTVHISQTNLKEND